MKGFIIACIYLMLSAFLWYVGYHMLLSFITDPSGGLIAACVFGWVVSVVIAVIVMVYYANSDPKLIEFFKKVNN